MLKRFWFKTEPPTGYGVTAESLAAAEQLLKDHGYPHSGQRVIEVVENIDMATLDQNHVLPNAGPVVVRGIWFPRHNI